MNIGKVAEDMHKKYGNEMFTKFLSEAIQFLQPPEFRKFWDSVPRHLRGLVLEPPPDVVLDVGSLPPKDQPAMYIRLNDLRRERCRPLATPEQRKYWVDDDWMIVPMSKTAYKHFWDVNRSVPLNTSDPVHWAAVAKYLEKCPHKPERGEHKKFLDRNCRSGENGVSPVKRQNPDSEMQHPKSPVLGPRSGQSPGNRSAPNLDSPEFEPWVMKRVEVDTAGFKLDTFEVAKSRKFEKK